MAKILACDGIDKNAIEELEKSGHSITESSFSVDELKQIVKQFEIIIVRSATKITKEIIDSALETKK